MGVKIRQLSAMLANQIAAGEVIERPASVVKELLENALDAGASHISIEIAHGGLNQIKISDNGSGIHQEDLPLAIAPHATSKIGELADLFKIESMGFRGEALASIASIARVSILSKTSEASHAHLLTVNEEGIQIVPCARNVGTTVDVCDLFYNAPVRKKFLKSAKLEFQAIETVVKRFALSAPDISLQLKHEGQVTLSLIAADSLEKEQQRLSKIFGQGFIRQAHYLSISHDNMRLTGFISGRDYQRSQNDKLWISVNQRMVKDKLLQHAIKSAYENILHPGRFPACFLQFSINPEAVDVNVHPTKHELRFQDPRIIHDFFTTHIRQALDNHTREAPVRDYPKIAKSNRDSVLQETYPSFNSASPWVMLDNQYGLLFKGHIPWLVDIKALSRQLCLHALHSTPKPLQSRPLLVPLYHAFDKQHNEINKVLDVLEQAGLACELIEPGLLQIMRLPVILPQLDVRKLLDTVLQKPLCDMENLNQILAESQYLDAFQMDNESKDNLAAFLLQLPEKEQATVARELHRERLSGIFV